MNNYIINQKGLACSNQSVFTTIYRIYHEGFLFLGGRDFHAELISNDDKYIFKKITPPPQIKNYENAHASTWCIQRIECRLCQQCVIDGNNIIVQRYIHNMTCSRGLQLKVTRRGLHFNAYNTRRTKGKNFKWKIEL